VKNSLSQEEKETMNYKEVTTEGVENDILMTAEKAIFQCYK
jgi:hypothetical protein